MSDNDATPTRQDVVANVDEIIEHVINANMLSMPYHVYVELFDAVDGLGVEIENLQSENARLRSELESVGTAAYLYGRGDLLAENAKLRELVNILAFCTNDEAHDCDKCVMNGAEMHVTVPEWLFCDSLIERLRTLGFEVTE